MIQIAKPARTIHSCRPRCVRAENAGARDSYFLWKRRMDFLLAVALLVPALPLMGILVLLVRLTSRGPGIYRQARVGRGGRTFTMYKIRSMASNAEAKTGAVWAASNDLRVTPLGRILRKLHLDELPQLVNVIRGEMSLVGPRPERPEFVSVLAESIEGYRERLAVAPGITGLAQVNLPPDSDLDSVRRKLHLDLEYLRTAGLWLDLRILVSTIARALRIPEFLILRLGVDYQVPGWVCQVARKTVSSGPAAATLPNPLAPVTGDFVADGLIPVGS